MKNSLKAILFSLGAAASAIGGIAGYAAWKIGRRETI